LRLENQYTSRLDFLDALRAVAALAVILQHGLELSVPGFMVWTTRNFSFGQAGVCLFFLISGFIIPLSLEKSGSNIRFWCGGFGDCFRFTGLASA